jgi:hypothetical protein
MQNKKSGIVIILSALIIIALAVGLPFFTKPSTELQSKFELSQLSLSAVGFFIAFLAFYFAYLEFRKSNTKAQLRLAFSEDGKRETSIQVSRVKDLDNIGLDFWIINNGNVISKLFQLELQIPGLFNSHFILEGRTLQCSSRDSGNNTVILSLVNNEKIVCFVNNPVKIEDVKLGTDQRGYDNYDDFIIYYRIISDWPKPITGNLRVHIKKG